MFETVKIPLSLETIGALYLAAAREGVSFDHYASTIIEMALDDYKDIQLTEPEDDGA